MLGEISDIDELNQSSIYAEDQVSNPHVLLYSCVCSTEENCSAHVDLQVSWVWHVYGYNMHAAVQSKHIYIYIP